MRGFEGESAYTRMRRRSKERANGGAGGASGFMPPWFRRPAPPDNGLFTGPGGHEFERRVAHSSARAQGRPWLVQSAAARDRGSFDQGRWCTR
jgi:hypothetical protein